MIALNTMILAAHGNEMAPVGAFLAPQDRPAWSYTLDALGEPAQIKAATVVDAEDIGYQALCLIVDSREKAPLIADENTKIWSVDAEGWVALAKLGVGESIRIPDVTRAGTVVTWGRVKRIIPASLPDRLFMGHNKMWGRLVLVRGHYSFASPCCFVHV